MLLRSVLEPVHIGDVLGFSSRFVPYQRTNDNGILYVFLGVRTKIRCKDAEKTSAASYVDRFLVVLRMVFLYYYTIIIRFFQVNLMKTST